MADGRRLVRQGLARRVKSNDAAVRVAVPAMPPLSKDALPEMEKYGAAFYNRFRLTLRPDGTCGMQPEFLFPGTGTWKQSGWRVTVYDPDGDVSDELRLLDRDTAEMKSSEGIVFRYKRVR